MATTWVKADDTVAKKAYSPQPHDNDVSDSRHLRHLPTADIGKDVLKVESVLGLGLRD